MGHVPHLYLPGPWDSARLAVDGSHVHHLSNVLRLADDSEVSYTDGCGTVGAGRWTGGHVERGEERVVPGATPVVTVAVAAPDARERQRYLVEKVAELGAARIRWLRTAHGGHRPPRSDRAQQWADAALEQSRGAHRTVVETSPVRLADLTGPVLVADVGGPPVGRVDHGEVTVAIGPEGGWAAGEIDGFACLGLGGRVLRVETAAVVAVHTLHR